MSWFSLHILFFSTDKAIKHLFPYLLSILLDMRYICIMQYEICILLSCYILKTKIRMCFHHIRNHMIFSHTILKKILYFLYVVIDLDLIQHGVYVPKAVFLFLTFWMSYQAPHLKFVQHLDILG